MASGEKIMTTTSGDPPREFAGHRLETLLRSAASGSLYQASSGDRSVALKVVSPSSRLDRSVIERFLRSSPDRIRHPNLLPVEELGEHDGETYYTARLLRGDSLRDALDDLRRGEPSRPSLGPLAVAPSPNGKRPAGYLARIATLMAEVADGLSQAHSQGIVHGRLSPSKLVFSPAGRLVITDFDGTDDDNPGELPYRSPELLRARNAASDPDDAAPSEPSADVYALGAILYELATLQAPYTGAAGATAASNGLETDSGATNAARTTEAILAGDLNLPRVHAPDLPPALEHCILKALAPGSDASLPQRADGSPPTFGPLRKAASPTVSQEASTPASLSAPSSASDANSNAFARTEPRAIRPKPMPSTRKSDSASSTNDICSPRSAIASKSNPSDSRRNVHDSRTSAFASRTTANASKRSTTDSKRGKAVSRTKPSPSATATTH